MNKVISPKTMRPRTIGVPLTDFEQQRFDAFLTRRGLKKKAFTRRAVLELMDRMEAEQAQESAS